MISIGVIWENYADNNLSAQCKITVAQDASGKEMSLLPILVCNSTVLYVRQCEFNYVDNLSA